MKRCILFLFLFCLALLSHAQSDTSQSTDQLLTTLDASLSQVEQMLKTTEIDMLKLKTDLARVSQLLIEARKLSTEQLELYQRLFERYQNVVESLLLLDRLYKSDRMIMYIEGGIIGALAITLGIVIAIK